MSLSAGLRAGDRPAADLARRYSLHAVVVSLTALAAVLRLYRLGFDYASPVADYDGAVYFSSALAFVDGHLPYRDYVLVQPPGIVLLLSPLALLAKAIGSAQAMALSKILTGLAGAAAVPLAAFVLRHRGPVVTTLGCAVLALQSDAVAAASTPLLEPWLVLCCLGSVALAFDGDDLAGARRLLFAGLLLGFACSIKIWAAAPAVVLIAVALRGRRGRAPLVGLLVGAGTSVLPFALAAPSAFWHEVIVDQLARSALRRTDTTFRLVHVFASSPPNAARATNVVWGLQVGVAVLVLGLVTLVWVRRPPRAPLEWFAVGAGLLVVAMLLAPSTFYWHYAAFSTPFIALAALLRLPQRRTAVAVVSAAVLVLAVVVLERYARPTHPYDNHAALRAVVPKGACIVSSMPGAVISADRFPASRDCPLLLDPFGEILAATGGHSPSVAELHRPAVVRIWLRAYRHADFVYLQARVTPQFPTDGLAQAYLERHFRAVPLAGPGRLYERIRR